MKITYPLLIDGGLSNELEKLGYDLNHKLWSAKLLRSHTEAITLVHLTYLEAGAQCITTSSYQATIPGFMSLGCDRDAAQEYILKSVHLAEEAIKRFKASGHKNSRPLIAASIGPYGAYLADGSEYHGNYGISDKTLHDFHLDRIRILDNLAADIFACETIPCFQEAKVLAEILKETKKTAWMSFSCKDEQHLNDGTHISKCAALLADHPNVFAIGVNCTAPKYISGLIKTLKGNTSKKKIIVYPNSGEVYHADSKTWMGITDPELFVKMAKEWIALGADIIGGCCRIGPDHIMRMGEHIMKPI